MLDKFFKLSKRFPVNNNRHPNDQMIELELEIQNRILQFTSMVRKELEINTRLSTVALLTVYVYFRDILKGLRD
jgi:hypothetical protein